MKETLLANGISRLDKRIDVDELVSRLDKETRNKFLRKLGVDADQLVSKLPSNVIAEDLDFWIDLGAKTKTIWHSLVGRISMPRWTTYAGSESLSSMCRRTLSKR